MGCCFLRGTQVRAADGGYRPVEALVAGDLLFTRFSNAAAIRRIISFCVKRDDTGRWPESSRPVRIKAGALADNCPFRDLIVTKGHAVFVAGALVPVGSLVNGKTIAFDDGTALDKLDYFHFEFDHHDIIDAEGALAESFRDEVKQPCVPILAYHFRRSQLASHLRSAIAPWADRRHKLDLIRDRLDARAGL